MSLTPSLRRQGASATNLSHSAGELLDVPPAPAELDPLIMQWPAGSGMVRCHASEYGATEFNPRRSAGRFRPFVVNRRTMPTLYGAESFEGALSETVFHDVPVTGPGRQILISSLTSFLQSTIAPTRPLRLADLRGFGLRRIGTTRAALIDSPASEYPATAQWAKALYECPQQPDGIIWTSRQYDRAAALILFGRRVSRRELRVIDPPRPLAIGQGVEDVRASAEAAGILIIE
jgi:RES domain